MANNYLVQTFLLQLKAKLQELLTSSSNSTAIQKGTSEITDQSYIYRDVFLKMLARMVSPWWVQVANNYIIVILLSYRRM